MSAGRPCSSPRPVNAARACGSACGVRSPERYGRNSTPSAPGSTSSASARSSSYATSGANVSRNQRSEPAAESITPIACQVPGTAWQKTWRRASGSGAYAGSAAKTTPEVPRTTESGPGPATPTPSAPAAWSPAPAATGVPFACSAGDLGRLQGRGQPLGRELERLEHLAAPAPLGDVEQERPRGIGHVGRALTRKAEAHIVLREEDVANPAVGLRLVRAQPEQLRRGEAGERPVAREANQPLDADSPLDLLALGRGALVVPEDRGPDHPVGLVEGHEPVHLAGEADSRRVLGAHCGQRSLARAPPVLGILLGPTGRGRGQRVLPLRPRNNLAVRRDGDRLDAGRADVEADERATARQAPRRRARRRPRRPCASGPHAARRRRAVRPRPR